MTDEPADLLFVALREPHRLLSLSPLQWDRLIRQARRGGLTARIEGLLARYGLVDRVPNAPRAHLEAARILAAAQRDEVLREVAHVERALGPLGVQVVLLKGAAYLLADLPAALGRTFSDVDILVLRKRLPEVESTLMLNGWAGTHHSAYDQRYYREWMHELPPMRHIMRQTVLDVHHAILPQTARRKPASDKLLAAARPLPGRAGMMVLSAPDMVLHSMAHLFHNDDLTYALRDLSDLDLLLRHFGADTAFWPHLLTRAAALDLERTLYYGLRHASVLLGTPVPLSTVESTLSAAPVAPLDRLMDLLWSQAFTTAHRPRTGLLGPACRWLLYLRAHWLRMPPLLLLRHLAIKAVRRSEPKPA